MLETYSRNPTFERDVAEYMSRFTYRVTLRLGPSHGREFKEFMAWCRERLGTQHKDWCVLSKSKDTYTLFCLSDKWAMFLALTYIDNIT